MLQVITALHILPYAVTPYLVLLPHEMQMPTIHVVVIWRAALIAMVQPCNSLLISNLMADEHLYKINGFAAATASLSRTFGPTVSGFLKSTGL
jgi:hypothetical protein